jgi:hypothetical protein
VRASLSQGSRVVWLLDGQLAVDLFFIDPELEAPELTRYLQGRSKYVESDVQYFAFYNAFLHDAVRQAGGQTLPVEPDSATADRAYIAEFFDGFLSTVPGSLRHQELRVLGRSYLLDSVSLLLGRRKELIRYLAVYRAVTALLASHSVSRCILVYRGRWFFSAVRAVCERYGVHITPSRIDITDTIGTETPQETAEGAVNTLRWCLETLLGRRGGVVSTKHRFGVWVAPFLASKGTGIVSEAQKDAVQRVVFRLLRARFARNTAAVCSAWAGFIREQSESSAGFASCIDHALQSAFAGDITRVQRHLAVLSLLRPAGVLEITYNSARAVAARVWCEAHRVPFAVIQHGSGQGTSVLAREKSSLVADAFYVWSDLFPELLMNKSDRQCAVLTGHPMFGSVESNAACESELDSLPTVLCAPPGWSVEIDHLYSYMHAVRGLIDAHPQMKVRLRFHPHAQYGATIRDWFDGTGVEFSAPGVSLKEDLADVALLLTGWSSVFVESLYYGTPVVFFGAHDERVLAAAGDAIPLAEDAAELQRLLAQLFAADAYRKLRSRQDAFFRTFFPLDGAERIASDFSSRVNEASGFNEASGRDVL